MISHRSSFSFATEPPKALGGALCLDFINTIGWRGNPDRRIEFLSSYSELIHWASQMGALAGKTGNALLAAASTNPAGANDALLSAVQLRTELEIAFDPALRRPTAMPVATSVVRAMGTSGVLAVPQGMSQMAWSSTETRLDFRLPLLPIAISGLELATSKRNTRVKRCLDPNCAWVFVDETRNNSRRWCSMEDCGNRAKVNAHYARRKRGE